MMAAPNLRTLLIFVAAGLLTACTPAGSDMQAQRPVLLNEEEVLAEYQAETERLQLAPGDRWDPHPLQLATDPGDSEGSMMFEKGVGAQTAQFQWYCSWAKVALSDEDLRDAALAHLEEFPTFSVWQDMDRNGHRLFTRIRDEAALGELDELDEYVANNCQDEEPGVTK